MVQTLRLEFITNDRVGMVLDLLKVLYCYGINVNAMEVAPGVVCLAVDKNKEISIDFLQEQLLHEKDILQVREITLLPQEKREKHITAVLDAASEGIIAVDREGIITTFNRAAEKILNIQAAEALGSSIAELLSPDVPVLKTIITGESYDNEEIILDTEKLKSHYITSGRPILDETGRPVGAVTSMQAIESVMKLVYSFTSPSVITFDEIIGNSDKIRRVKDMAQVVAKGNSTVLIQGESGTGKELFARSIHMASPRKNKPFVPVNCAALPDSLLESELFGYESGAFTGAKKGGKQGLFKYADKGTIFLDEISELPLHLQVKLLRVLQESRIRKVGAEEEISIDVRVIASTNRNLEDMIKKGQFRRDLFYRLAVIPLVIPPLRERKEDIPILAAKFISKLSQKMNIQVDGISKEALKKLQYYDWPGNIRELANVIERAMYLCGPCIEATHLILKEDEFDELIDKEDQRDELHLLKLKDLVAQTEKNAINDALKRYGSIRKAGRILGVSHGTVINKMKLYGITTNH